MYQVTMVRRNQKIFLEEQDRKSTPYCLLGDHSLKCTPLFILIFFHSSSLNAAANTHECWVAALTSCLLPFSFFPLGCKELNHSPSLRYGILSAAVSTKPLPVFIVYLFLYSPFHTGIPSPPSVGSRSNEFIDNLLFPCVLVEGCFECMHF